MARNGERDCKQIYEQWHEFTKAREADKLIDLYADDAIVETPLVTAILDHKTEGVLRGRAEIKHFFDEGLRRRPDELLRWYRTGLFFTNGKVVTWEYPRQTPAGNQIDLVEVMDVEDGKITHHRIYWGWFGTRLLLRNALGKAARKENE
jgi:predicted SnoaL-like aldol condensation-catalyzing enzyme